MPARELVLQNFLGCQCLDWTEAKRTQGRNQSLALPSGTQGSNFSAAETEVYKKFV